MANHKSAEKCIRKTVRRTAINTARKSRVRTFLKNVEVALSAGNKNQAKEALHKAESEMMRGVRKGLYHINTAARKISRLSKRLRSLAS